MCIFNILCTPIAVDREEDVQKAQGSCAAWPYFHCKTPAWLQLLQPVVLAMLEDREDSAVKAQ